MEAPKPGTPEYAQFIEKQREYGRKGGLARAEQLRARAELRDDAKALAEFALAAHVIAKEFLDAALGRGKWANDDGQPLLDPKDRIAAMRTCLDYGIGRARQMAADAKEPEPEVAKGVVFGVKPTDTAKPVPGDAEGAA